MTAHPTSPQFKENAHRALGDDAAAEGARQCPAGLHRQARRRRRQAAGVRGAARQRARHQEPHARTSRPLSRALRGEGDGGRRPRALGPHGGGGARRHPRHLPARRRQDRHQGQVDDLRGDRAQRRARSGTGCRRSRPISANTSSSSATRCRPTSSRRPCISTRRRSRATSAASTRISTPSAISRSRCSCSPRRAPCCASASSPPMSASPAPISWSPRPAPRSSSPTRAMAT